MYLVHSLLRFCKAVLQNGILRIMPIVLRNVIFRLCKRKFRLYDVKFDSLLNFTIIQDLLQNKGKETFFEINLKYNSLPHSFEILFAVSQKNLKRRKTKKGRSIYATKIGWHSCHQYDESTVGSANYFLYKWNRL